MELNIEVPRNNGHPSQQPDNVGFRELSENRDDSPVAAAAVKISGGNFVGAQPNGKELWEMKENRADAAVNISGGNFVGAQPNGKELWELSENRADAAVNISGGNFVGAQPNGKELWEMKENRDSSGVLREILLQKERELEEADKRASEVEAHLRLYSEIVSFRKQLRIVEEDKERISRQLSVLRDVVAENNERSGREIEDFEYEADMSCLQHVWKDVCRQNPTDRLDDSTFWPQVSIENISQRLGNAKEKFNETVTTAAQLYKELEPLSLTGHVKDAKSYTPEELRAELAKLADVKKRLRQMDNDQLFHIHRGTYVKDSVIPLTKREDAINHRVYTDECNQVRDVNELEVELKELKEKVRNITRELKDNKQSYDKIQEELTDELREAEVHGKEAQEMRTYFEQEQERLKGLKVDIQRILNYLRVRNRELTV